MEKMDAIKRYFETKEIEEQGDHYGLSTYTIDGEEYAIGTDEECDKACGEYIKTTVWAFNADFIIEHSKVLDYDDVSYKILEVIQEECESGNECILKLIDDIDEFVEDAIQTDGRGHFLSSYDGDEIVIGDNHFDDSYFAYRI